MLRGAERSDRRSASTRSARSVREVSARVSLWKEVECLGACVNAPMASINDYSTDEFRPATAWQRTGSATDRRRDTAEAWPRQTATAVPTVAPVEQTRDAQRHAVLRQGQSSEVTDGRRTASSADLYGLRRTGAEGARRRAARGGGTEGDPRRRAATRIVDDATSLGLAADAAARGVSTGLKSTFMPKKVGRAAAAISSSTPTSAEPGTCKDRDDHADDPHLLVEGCLIAGFRHAAPTPCYIYCAREYHPRARRL